MPTLTYPGVYIQEVSSGVRPIEVASTSTAAFVGLTEMGPTEGAKRITNWTEFQRYFGGFFADSYLAYSVFQFFNNGGRQCYIVRVTRSDATTANVTVQNRDSNSQTPSMTFSAKNKGAWGNYLYLQIEDGSLDPGNEFKVSVRRQTDPTLVPANFREITPLEVHDNLSVDPDASNCVVNVLKQNSTLIDAQVLDNTSVQNGVHYGGWGVIELPLNDKLNFQINIDGDGFQQVALPPSVGAMTDLVDVAKEIRDAVKSLANSKRKTSTLDISFTQFTCDPETSPDGTQRRLVLTSGTAGINSSVIIQPASTNDLTGRLYLGAGNGGRSENGLAIRCPANADAIQLGDAAVVAPVMGSPNEPILGSYGTNPITETTFSDAFSRLDNLTDFSLLAVPGEGTTAMMDAGMAYCANRPLQDVFYIGEMLEDDYTPDEAASFRNRLTKANSYGALYFPWVKAIDPTGKSKQPILLPPSGYLAGLYARIDASRGVWKAPAGTEASLNGVVGLAVELNDIEHGNLNPKSVNVIRRFPAAGIVAYGARTISSDPEWKYVPVRRTAIMLRVSIYNGIQWAVFEPNDESLWSQLRLNIGSFMMILFRQGAFQGSTPSQAFFVKCDAETTTQADIDLGIVNVLVGFAPLKPAEFVVVKISQRAGQASS